MLQAVEVQALCGQLDRREISHLQFVEKCARMIGGAIGCSRAGVWVFLDTDQGRVLRCLGIHDRVRDRMVLAPDETGAQVPEYFRALEEVGHIVASEARTHPATAGFFRTHPRPQAVYSLLAVSFSVNGELFGTFTCTQLGEVRHWTSAQLIMLKRIAARASLALAGATRTARETMPMPL